MKKLIIILIAGIVLTGCSMTNDEIIAEAKKCEDAGLISGVASNLYTGSIIRVTCIPVFNPQED